MTIYWTVYNSECTTSWWHIDKHHCGLYLALNFCRYIYIILQFVDITNSFGLVEIQNLITLSAAELESIQQFCLSVTLIDIKWWIACCLNTIPLCSVVNENISLSNLFVQFLKVESSCFRLLESFVNSGHSTNSSLVTFVSRMKRLQWSGASFCLRNFLEYLSCSKWIKMEEYIILVLSNWRERRGIWLSFFLETCTYQDNYYFWRISFVYRGMPSAMMTSMTSIVFFLKSKIK